MKTIRVVTIICWITLGAIFLGLIGWFLSGTIFGLRPAWIDRSMPFRVGIGGVESLTGPFTVAGTHSSDPSAITSIDIDWVSGEVKIIPHDGGSIEITELAQRTLHDDERMSVNISANTLTIEFLDRNVSPRIGRMPPKRLEVLVPRPLSESLDNLDISSVSGRVELSDMSVSGADISTTSGAISLTQIISSELSLNSISGAIHVSDTSSNTLALNTTSGAIHASGAFSTASIDSTSGRVSLDNSTVQSNANINTVSGASDLSGAFYSIDTNTVSGNVSIRSIIVPSALNIGSISGTVAVTIPNEGSITVRHSSASGRFNSEIPVLLQSRGAQFNFSTTSGNIDIYELK